MSKDLQKRSLEGQLKRANVKLKAAKALLRRFEEANGTKDSAAHSNLVAVVEEND